eukprot:scaffold313262_cov21-Tisochrysis_lutea.AAC.1
MVPAGVPVLGVGHSNGALLHLLNRCVRVWAAGAAPNLWLGACVCWGSRSSCTGAMLIGNADREWRPFDGKGQAGAAQGHMMLIVCSMNPIAYVLRHPKLFIGCSMNYIAYVVLRHPKMLLNESYQKM